MRNGAFCRAAGLTYDPSIWPPESRRNKSESSYGERLLRAQWQTCETALFAAGLTYDPYSARSLEKQQRIR